MNATQSYERELSEKLVPALLNVPGLTFYGMRDHTQFERRTPTVSIRMEGATPRELAVFLGRRGIFAWDGNYYALNVTERLGVEEQGGMVRIGLVHYNTAERSTG
jgi:selenocysteine lyase/cysteine desulfurase